MELCSMGDLDTLSSHTLDHFECGGRQLQSGVSGRSVKPILSQSCTVKRHPCRLQVFLFRLGDGGCLT